MFNMIAGSSTGGVIAAALSCPMNGTLNQAYPANAILRAFKIDAPKIFAQRSINTGLLTIVVIVSLLMGLFLGLRIGNSWYMNPKVEETLRNADRIILQNKKKMKRENTLPSARSKPIFGNLNIQPSNTLHEPLINENFSINQGERRDTEGGPQNNDGGYNPPD